MHDIATTLAVIEKNASERRGATRRFSAIDPRRTAHIVVDMQDAFLAADALAHVPAARENIASINHISATLRSAGGTVAYLQHTYTEDDQTSWSNYFDHLGSPERRQHILTAFSPGSDGHRLSDELDIHDSDLIVPKHRFCPWIAGSSNLHGLMLDRDIDTLIVTGTMTNVCCDATARGAMMLNYGAMMLNYKVLFVADATATHDDATHNKSLTELAPLFCDVIDSRAVLETIARTATP